MKKICPICQTTLNTNCYVKDNGSTTLSYLELIIKDDNLKKQNYELKSCYCPNCGHVEFFIDLKTQHTNTKQNSSNKLEKTVQDFAKEYLNRKK